MQGYSLGVGGHRQQDLWTVRTMIAAVAIPGQSSWPPAFKVSTAQIIERQTHSLRKSSLIKSFLGLHPMAAHLIHGLVEVVLSESLCRGQSASRCQPGALGLGLQTELGAGKEQSGVDHRLEQPSLTRGTHRRQKAIHPKACPGVIENGQPAVIQRFMQ